jgi:hypothetical protein
MTQKLLMNPFAPQPKLYTRPCCACLQQFRLLVWVEVDGELYTVCHDCYRRHTK